MSEFGRALVILAVVGVTVGSVSLWSFVRALSRRRTVRTEPLRPWPAAVLFSSNDCDACDPVRDVIRTNIGEDRFREIVYQREANLFRSVGIEKVPAVVLVDPRGRAVDVLEGPIRLRRIRRAARRAGVG